MYAYGTMGCMERLPIILSQNEERTLTKFMFNAFKKVAIGLTTTFFLCTNLNAQESKDLGEVIVTANKFPQKQTQTGRILTILSDSVLRANSGKPLTTILSQQAGVFIVGSEQPLGSLQGVYVRGAGSGYTLILIDGVPVYDPSSVENNFDLNLLNVNQISRIEILKGGQSTVYGSDAVAGVINIITQRPDAKKITSGTVSGGSYGTLQANLGFGNSIGKTTFEFQLGAISTKGFSSAHDASGKDAFEADGFKQMSLRTNVKHQFSDNLSGKLYVNIARNKNDLDAGAFTDDKDYTGLNLNKQIGLGFEYGLKKGRVLLNFNRNISERTYINDSTFVPATAFSKYDKSFYGTTSNFVELYGNFGLSDAVELVTGLDYRTQNTDQTYVSMSDWGRFESPAIEADKANINIFSGFASLVFKKSKGVGAEAGLRFNNNSNYGSNFTYTLNPYFWVNDRLKLLLSAASSFKAPSLYQLYSPYGNLNLKPETAYTIDAGVQLFGKTPKNYARMLYFRRDIENVIFFQSLPKEPYGQYINLNTQNDSGVEIEGVTELGKLRISANYTCLTGAVTTQNAKGTDTTYNNLIRRPANMLNLSVGYNFSSKLIANVALRSVSKRTDLFFNDLTYKTESVDLAAYTTIDLYAAYRPRKEIRIFVDLRNITNQQYFDLTGFANRRFNFMAGVGFEF